MISFEEYKTLCRNQGLVPCTRAGFYKKEDATSYMIPFSNDIHNRIAGKIVAEYNERWGVKIAFDIAHGWNFGPYLITIEQFEKALIDLTKEVKEYKYKRMIENINEDF